MPTRAVFLDRDGVLIRSPVHDGLPVAITVGDPVHLLDGIEDGCRALKADGFLLVMVTNQPDVVRGRTPRSFVEATNRALAERLGLDSVQVCFHDAGDDCTCRKPRPGMLLAAAAEFAIDLTDSVMVGDRSRDIEAGRRAGCRTVLINHGYRETLANPPDYTARTAVDAICWIRTQAQ